MHKIQYLRIILTNRCNLKCFFCHKEGLQEDSSFDIDYELLKTYIIIFIKCGIRKIKFMGGEPTLYPYLIDLIEFIYSIDTSIDISVISNGIMAPEKLDALINSHVNRVNISLHGYYLKEFCRITGGTVQKLQTLLNTVDILDKHNKLGKINYVLLKDINIDEFLSVLKFIHEHNYVLDVLNYLGNEHESIKKYYVEFDEIYELIYKNFQIEKEKNFVNNYSISSKRLYLQNGGIVNLKVNKLSDYRFLKSCLSCSKKEFCKEGIAAIRLTTNGKIKPCLFRNDNMLDMRSIIKNNGLNESIDIINSYFEEL